MISVVLPVCNEEASLESVCAEIQTVAERAKLAIEIVLVDDGSTDNSWAVITKLAQAHSELRGIRLRRNFGKSAALAAGLDAARGRYICTMDSDGQDDPAEIPALLAAMKDKQLDLVCGWKQPRLDPWHKTIPSRFFNYFVGALTGVRLHDHNCGLKLGGQDVFREFRLYGERHRFIPVLAHAEGFRVGEISVNHRPRRFGHSKYGSSRFLKGLMDLFTVRFLTGFHTRPQHPLGIFGFLFFVAGMVGLTYLAGTWFYSIYDPSTYTPLMKRPLLTYSVGAFLFGAQMITMGFIAALFMETQVSRSQPYRRVEEVGGEAPSVDRQADREVGD